MACMPCAQPAGFVFEKASRTADEPAGARTRSVTLLAAAGPDVRVLDKSEVLETLLRDRSTSGEGVEGTSCSQASSTIRSRVIELIEGSVVDQRGHQGHRRDLAPSFNDGQESADPSSIGDDGGPRNNEGVVGKEADGTKDSVRSTPASRGDSREERQGREALASEVDELHECEECKSLAGEKRNEIAVPDLHDTPGDVGSDASGYSGSAGVAVGMDNPRLPCTIFMLSGWSLGDMQTLIQGFPDTPWLYLYDDTDPVQMSVTRRERSARTALALSSMSRLSGSARGMLLPMSRFGASSATRVLTRHFDVPVTGVGELHMAQVDAALSGSISSGAANRLELEGFPRGEAGFLGQEEKAAVGSSGCEVSEVSACADDDLRRELLEASVESTKALGGEFDTDWWWQPSDRGDDQDDASASGTGPLTSRKEASDGLGEARDPPRVPVSTRTDAELFESGVELWRKGLRRMVDTHAPSWMSSEAYSEPMEPFDCPDVPDASYPREWPLTDLLSNWSPGPGNGSSLLPPRHYLGICRFDYETELHKAQTYSTLEVPFVLYNVPPLDRAVREWSDPVRLSEALGDQMFHVDVSSSSRFLYFGKRKKERPQGWTPPTRKEYATFGSWLRKALREGEDNNATWTGDGDSADLTDGQHDQKSYYYLKFSHSSERPLPFVERSLPFFRQPSPVADADVDADAAGDGSAGGFDAGGMFRAKGDKPPGDEMASVVEGEDPPSRYSEREPNGQEASGSGKAAFSRPRGKGSQYWHGFSERRRGSFISDVEGPEGEEAGEDLEIGSGEESGDAGMDVFLREARSSKGIHCRIGMDGVMSEGHYDGSRNMVAVLAGKRRWILSNPRSCKHMYMFPPGHPSARHTSVDWTDPDVGSSFPRLAKATANEVILRAGEVLYVPEHWIHSVVNIGISAQCNCRSGRSFLYSSIIDVCELRAGMEYREVD